MSSSAVRQFICVVAFIVVLSILGQCTLASKNAHNALYDFLKTRAINEESNQNCTVKTNSLKFCKRLNSLSIELLSEQSDPVNVDHEAETLYDATLMSGDYDKSDKCKGILKTLSCFLKFRTCDSDNALMPVCYGTCIDAVNCIKSDNYTLSPQDVCGEPDKPAPQIAKQDPTHQNCNLTTSVLHQSILPILISIVCVVLFHDSVIM